MLKVKTNISTVTQWYIPDEFKEQELPPRFNLRGLDGMQFMEISNEVEQIEGGGFRVTARGLRQSIYYGVVNWENVFDEEGRVLQFSRDNLKFLPPSLLGELSSKILDMSTLSEIERKKSV